MHYRETMKKRRTHQPYIGEHQYVTSDSFYKVPDERKPKSKFVIAVSLLVIAAVILFVGTVLYKHYEPHLVTPGTVPRGNDVTQPPQSNTKTTPTSTTSNGAVLQ